MNPCGHFPFIELVCNLLAGKRLNPKKRPFCLRFFKNGRVETYVISYAMLVVSPLSKGRLNLDTTFTRTCSFITLLVNMPLALLRPTSHSRDRCTFPKSETSSRPSRLTKKTPDLLHSLRCSTTPWHTATSKHLCEYVGLLLRVGEPRSRTHTIGLFRMLCSMNVQRIALQYHGFTFCYSANCCRSSVPVVGVSIELRFVLQV